MRRVGMRSFVAALLPSLLMGCGELSTSEAQNVVEALAQRAASARNARSVLQIAHDEHQRGVSVREAAAPGPSDTLEAYAQKCNEATGITLPSFRCEDGSTIPNQGSTPAYEGGTCDRPNVLNGQCDPGSRFQVLPGASADAVAVAHCRKDGNPVEGTQYGDIAIIQYNRVNGAVCFFQALSERAGEGELEGIDVDGGKEIPAPGGPAPWRWLSPKATQGIGCTGCHDSGALVRSPYLTQQLVAAPGKPRFALPSQASAIGGSVALRYVGLDYRDDRSWSIELEGGSPCTTCHRLSVNETGRGAKFGCSVSGTATTLARKFTAQEQPSRLREMPPWMPPGAGAFSSSTASLAKRYEDCAVGFLASNPHTAPPGCIIDADAPLGRAF